MQGVSPERGTQERTQGWVCCGGRQYHAAAYAVLERDETVDAAAAVDDAAAVAVAVVVAEVGVVVAGAGETAVG